MSEHKHISGVVISPKMADLLISVSQPMKTVLGIEFRTNAYMPENMIAYRHPDGSMTIEKLWEDKAP